MFKHLLIPLDGSRLAESVLPIASLLARTLGATVTLAHLIERDAPHEVHGERHLAGQEEATRYLADVAQRFFGEGSEVLFHVHAVAVKDVAESIVEHACEFECDLIVMCTHGKRGLRRLMVGSIAQRVIGMGSLPVLLVQPGEAPPPESLARILVALDGDPVHERALPIAAALARSLGASLHLVTVVPTIATISGAEAATGIMLPGTTQALLEMNESAALTRLARLAQGLEADGAAATISALRGDPPSCIAREALARKADLIALGTHGKAGLTAFWSGSVAPHILQQTHLPLLLVPVHDARKE